VTVRFQPSPYSYGQAEVTVTKIEESVSSTSEAAPAEGKKTDPLAVLGTAVPIVQDLLFGGKSERESVAELEAKLANAKQAYQTAPSMQLGGIALPGGKEYYANQIRKLEAQITAARVQAEEEQLQQDLYTAGNVAMVFGLFALAGVVGVYGVRQVQEARKTQAEIERIRGGE
jgi:hypothetical protein